MQHYFRQNLMVSALLVAVLFLLPLTAAKRESIEVPSEEPEYAEPVEPPAAAKQPDAQITLRVLHGEQVEEMMLNDYLIGVVRAEMPASFEIEALKAQAAAARTYTLHKLRNGGGHGETADICTKSTCCQAYIDEETARENWGKEAAAYEKKVADAVHETDGQAILYGGEPILAVFHASSAGLTRPAAEVWSGDLPYLQAVPSVEGEDIPNYYSRMEFTPEEFKSRILAVWEGADLSGKIAAWLKNAETDAAGSVKTVEVGGIAVRGTQLRAALGLRSACFTWEIQNGNIVFFVTGYGHGVGLSQCGANQMAKDGADWKEILMHYYTGVSVGAYRFTNDSQA